MKVSASILLYCGASAELVKAIKLKQKNNDMNDLISSSDFEIDPSEYV